MAANLHIPHKIRSLVTLLHQYYRVRFNATHYSSQLQGLHGIVPTTRIGYGGSVSPGLRFISSGERGEMVGEEVEEAGGGSSSERYHRSLDNLPIQPSLGFYAAAGIGTSSITETGT
ncbi:hypothetical protein HAX54_036808 [Datura stramonium]|uniref:Uncharacterized protein n=1 Tax=Datura stramonium TaxID=4076 RepID=A0ABS8RN51_DATST|nr:hypothetical protein [Datura stramonium]